jgi:hypothetical protein
LADSLLAQLREELRGDRVVLVLVQDRKLQLDSCSRDKVVGRTEHVVHAPLNQVVSHRAHLVPDAVRQRDVPVTGEQVRLGSFRLALPYRPDGLAKYRLAECELPGYRRVVQVHGGAVDTVAAWTRPAT